MTKPNVVSDLNRENKFVRESLRDYLLSSILLIDIRSFLKSVTNRTSLHGSLAAS